MDLAELDQAMRDKLFEQEHDDLAYFSEPPAGWEMCDNCFGWANDTVYCPNNKMCLCSTCHRCACCENEIDRCHDGGDCCVCTECYNSNDNG